MSKCSECRQEDGNITAVIHGSYYPSLCAACKARLNAGQRVSSGAARWARTIDLEDHEADIQQPHNADGTPNGRFCRLYPDKARYLFTDEQIRRAQ